MFCTRLSCGHGRAVVTVALILRLTWGSAVVTAFAQSPPAEGEQAAVAELRKVAANIQSIAMARRALYGSAHPMCATNTWNSVLACRTWSIWPWWRLA